jgi:hypothetical protein
LLPEAYFELEVKLKSPVPVIASICPKETIKVWKTRTSIRIDWSIAKVSGFKIARAPMSFVARIETDGRIEAFVINRDEGVYETICPTLSKSILHDIVDTCLRDGVVAEDIPVRSFEFKRSVMKLGALQRERTSHLRKYDYDTEVFKLNNLTCKQHFRVPVIQPQLYDMCTDNCRSVRVIDHLRHTKEVFSNKASNKIENLAALQFISESDLMLDDEGGADGDNDVSKATFAFKKTDKVTDEDVTLVERTVRDFVSKAGRAASKHFRSLTRSSVFRSRTKTSGSIALNDNCSIITLNSTVEVVKQQQQHSRHGTSQSARFAQVMEKDFKSMTLEDLEYVRMHIRSFPDPTISVTADQYFADGQSRLHLSRDCHQSTSNYYRDKPMTVYKAKEFPYSVYDFLPIIEWLTRKSIQPGELKKFVDEHLYSGFPVRVEIPIFAMLELKLTVTKAEKKVNLEPEDFYLPKGVKEGEIFPLVEFD